jgi:hypothetical protein
MKKIPLTQGLFAIVDDEDFKRLSKFKWWAERDHSTRSVRARRYSHLIKTDTGKLRKIYVFMHNEILANQHSGRVDHINLDTLDNRRSNLRLCSHKQNCRNRRMRSDNTTGFKAVKKNKKGFGAFISTDQGRVWTGTFRTAIEAARAYNEAAKKHYGEFARLNPV